MNHPIVGQCITELDTVKTRFRALAESSVVDAAQAAALRTVIDLINQVVLAIPHVQVPNA